MDQTCEAMNKNRILGASTGRAGNLLRSPISIKGAKRRFGDCARKAAELTPGDLLRVASATEVVVRQPDHGTEVSIGHASRVSSSIVSSGAGGQDIRSASRP